MDNDKNDNKKSSNDKNDMMDWIKSIAFAIIIAVFIKTFLFNSTYVLGNSMYPTLHEKDRLFSVKVSLIFKGPERGDIVIIKAPDSERKDYIKRVIGIEGDLVEIIEGRVYLNKKLLEEDYIEEGSYTHIYNKNTWTVPEGEIFVLGDNREKDASKDSRSFGTVPSKSVKGITGFRYFPLNDDFGSLD
ncbi:MAG: signal peptidase I [Tissierella sp.]|uniref:signal peptidase I n=1 Tax=Tissierella sp. TaxID=41274 RepID=UPI003F9D2E20